MPSACADSLDIAIIGGGIGGLSGAIALSGLPNVSVRLFEQAPELKEIGAGISISYNSWNVLELLGAANGVKGPSTVPTLKRNGYTGEIVDSEEGSSAVPAKRGPVRVRRTRLQAALAAQIPKGTIQFNKKLLSLQNLERGGVRLTFQDGTETTADLVVGGDGIRSAVRHSILPGHELRYTGNTAFRVLVPAASLSRIHDLPLTTAWWHGAGGHVYLSPVDEESEAQPLIEFSCRSFQEPEVAGKTVSWGIPVRNEKMLSRFKDYDPRLREALAQVPEGEWKQFSLFSGPCLEKVTGWDKVVLIGDASHPLAGAFGSGAAFAMEDGWILARAVEHARSSSAPIADALEIFDSIRSPYYLRMYQFRDSQKASMQKVRETTYDNFDSAFRARMTEVGIAGRRPEGYLDWVYKNDISKVWENYLQAKKRE